MHLVVLVKGVPDFREGKVQFKEDNTLNRGATPTVLNPNDKLALEAAREIKVKHGATVHVVSMGPPNYAVILKEAMGIVGDKLYLLSDMKLAGADTWATAWALSTGIQRIGAANGGVDLVIAGFKTADGETGQTGPQAALLLKRPIVTHTTRLSLHPEEGTFEAERLVEDEIEVCAGPLPGFIVTDPGFTATYKKASERLTLIDVIEQQAVRVKTYEQALTKWDQAALGVDEFKVGLKGSPTIVRMVEPIPVPPASRKARVLDGRSTADIEEAARLIVEKAGIRR